jgi:hypothetical protein
MAISTSGSGKPKLFSSEPLSFYSRRFDRGFNMVHGVHEVKTWDWTLENPDLKDY